MRLPSIFGGLFSYQDGQGKSPAPDQGPALTALSPVAEVAGDVASGSFTAGKAGAASSTAGAAYVVSRRVALGEDLAEQARLLRISQPQLDAAMRQVSVDVQPWAPGEFATVRTLQDAVRNHGRVDLMKQTMPQGDVRPVAVKRMPNRWVRHGPDEFAEQYPTSSERPWCDIGIVRHLNEIKFPHVCELYGVFRDEETTYVATSLATEGDLFGWCDREPKPGVAREAVMRPIIVQVVAGVRWLHELGVAHRDLSLENILLTSDPGGGGPRIKIIDFGMMTLQRHCQKEVRGKQSYQAPEMHLAGDYDAFLADAFAVGVVIFAMAAQDYPWTSTKGGNCQLFQYVCSYGFRKFLAKRKVRKGHGEHLLDVLSPEFVDLVEGLLQADAKDRLTLGELCYEESRESVLGMAWLDGPASVNSKASH